MLRPSIQERFVAKVRKTDTCWEWIGAKSLGYGVLEIQGRRCRAHRISVWLATGEHPPEHLHVCHHCDNPSCVNPAHLFIGTNQENMQDAKRKGRTRTGNHKGTNNGRCVLTPDDVIAIRQRTEPSHVVAADYGISAVAIRKIRQRVNWRHL